MGVLFKMENRMQFGDTLGEICKISAVKATAALSKFLQTPVSISKTLIDLNSQSEFDNQRHNEITTSLFLPIKGNMGGAALLLYSTEAAFTICDKVFKRAKSSSFVFSEAEISALSEIANVMVGNFLTSLATSLQMDLLIHHMAVFNCAPLQDIMQQIGSMLVHKVSQEPISFYVKFECFNVTGNLVTFFNKEKLQAAVQNINY